jgi:hypothetical protein
VAVAAIALIFYGEIRTSIVILEGDHYNNCGPLIDPSMAQPLGYEGAGAPCPNAAYGPRAPWPR